MSLLKRLGTMTSVVRSLPSFAHGNFHIGTKYLSKSFFCAQKDVLDLHATLELDCNTVLGECTIWDDVTNTVCWIDSEDCKFFKYDPIAKHCDIYDLPEKPGSFALCHDTDSYLFAFEHGPALYNPKTNTILKRIFEWKTDTNANCITRPNDGRVDRQGRFVFGGMQLLPHSVDTFEFASAVYRINADLTYQKLSTLAKVRAIGCANSICFNKSGDIMYFTDSFDIENGSNIKKFRYYSDHRLPQYLGDFANLADIENDGFSDGSIVDNNDAVWSARAFGSKVYRFDKNGKVDGIIHVPEPKVACITFGGKELDTMYINTIALGSPMDSTDEGIQQEEYKHIGGLYSIKLPDSIKGCVENRFGN